MSESTDQSNRATVAKMGRSKPHASGENAVDILETVSDEFMALDREWRYTYVNPAAERIMGLERDDMVGRIVWELASGLPQRMSAGYSSRSSPPKWAE